MKTGASFFGEVFRIVAPFGNNVSAAIEASTGVADFAEKLIAR